MEYGTTIRVFGRHVHVTALATLMTALGLAYAGQIALQGGLGRSERALEFGGTGYVESWAAGAIGPGALFERGEWWRLVSSIFLHGSLLHLVMNAWALFQLGRITEIIYGTARTMIAFLGTGIVAAVISAGWRAYQGHPGISVGASGAVCGLLGLMFAHMRSRQDVVAQMVSRSLGIWTLMILFFGWSQPRIDNAAHIGGFVAGWVLARVLRTGHFVHLERGMARHRGTIVAWALIAVACVALAIAGIGARDRHHAIVTGDKLQTRIRSALAAVDGSGPIDSGKLTALTAVQTTGELAQMRNLAIAAVRSGDATPERSRRVLNELQEALGRRGFTLAPDLYVSGRR